MRQLLVFSLFSCVAHLSAQEPLVDVRDGNEYSTATIGEQVWMAENLKFLPKITFYKNYSIKKPLYYVSKYKGDDLDEVKHSESYFKRGVLYNYAAATTACPIGWHLPTNDDWTILAEYIVEDKGGESNYYKMLPGSVPGTYGEIGRDLKSTTTWVENKGDDTYGFNADPTYVYMPYINDGDFDFMIGAMWWSTNEELDCAYYRSVFDHNNNSAFSRLKKNCGLSIRCIKGDPLLGEADNFSASHVVKEYCEFIDPNESHNELRIICEDDDHGDNSWREIKKMAKRYGGRVYKR